MGIDSALLIYYAPQTTSKTTPLLHTSTPFDNTPLVSVLPAHNSNLPPALRWSSAVPPRPRRLRMPITMADNFPISALSGTIIPSIAHSRQRRCNSGWVALVAGVVPAAGVPTLPPASSVQSEFSLELPWYIQCGYNGIHVFTS